MLLPWQAVFPSSAAANPPWHWCLLLHGKKGINVENYIPCSRRVGLWQGLLQDPTRLPALQGEAAGRRVAGGAEGNGSHGWGSKLYPCIVSRRAEGTRMQPAKVPRPCPPRPAGLWTRAEGRSLHMAFLPL